MNGFSGFKGKLEESFPLGLKTTWRIGGKADYFAIPQDLEDLVYLLDKVKKIGTPLYIIGRGSNLLIEDAGVPGVTVHLGSAFQYIKRDGTRLTVGACTPMPTLAIKAATLGFSGYEHLIGIPGTVGAGIVINAGKGTAGDMDMRGILKTTTYLTERLTLEVADGKDLDLVYRSSRLKNSMNIVVEGDFELNKVMDQKLIEGRQKEIIAERQKKFPVSFPSSGSVFKKPENAPPAGKLIETAGLKGYRVGGAQVSTVHANFLINVDSATSLDMKNLISEIIEKVSKFHGIVLEREVIFWPEEANWKGK